MLLKTIKGIYMAHMHITSEVRDVLRTYGQRVRTARVRRRWTREDLAARVGVERRTIARMEAGEAGIGLGVFLTALWALDLWHTVNDVADPGADRAGIFLEQRRQPKRVHREQDRKLDF